MHFSGESVCYIAQSPYICNVFFMVLDLRLTMRLAVRDGWPFLFYYNPLKSTSVKRREGMRQLEIVQGSLPTASK